jgi:hypothetical protein
MIATFSIGLPRSRIQGSMSIRHHVTSSVRTDGANDEARTSMTSRRLVPHGESLRRAIRWLGEQDRHDVATLEEAARQFDLTPLEEQFLLEHFRCDDRSDAAPPD